MGQTLRENWLCLLQCPSIPAAPQVEKGPHESLLNWRICFEILRYHLFLFLFFYKGISREKSGGGGHLEELLQFESEISLKTQALGSRFQRALTLSAYLPSMNSSHDGVIGIWGLGGGVGCWWHALDGCILSFFVFWRLWAKQFLSHAPVTMFGFTSSPQQWSQATKEATYETATQDHSFLLNCFS